MVPAGHTTIYIASENKLYKFHREKEGNTKQISTEQLYICHTIGERDKKTHTRYGFSTKKYIRFGRICLISILNKQFFVGLCILRKIAQWQTMKLFVE